MYERMFDAVTYNENTLRRFYRALVDVSGVDADTAVRIIEDTKNEGFIIAELVPSWTVTPESTSRGSDV